MDCNITVPDKLMSGKHATILFKNGKFKIKDELSSHGTFLNERDIEDEHIELHENDFIRMGETIFKFKIAL
jgi:pSer/pThr/pTyr-binding forkhead associated (FHA) protein